MAVLLVLPHREFSSVGYAFTRPPVRLVMRAVYEAENLIDAHLVRGRLVNEGIEAMVRGEFLTGAMGELPMSGLLAVCVAEPDVPRAADLLALWAAERAASSDDGDEPEWDDDLTAGSFRA